MLNRLLLVDDDPFSIRMLEDMLRSEWRIVNETTIDTIVMKLERETPNVVLLNGSLRRIDGEPVFDAIRKHSPRVPIIVYTPVGLQKLGRTLMRKGAFWHLPMPLNTDDLIHVLNTALAIEKNHRTAQDTRRDFAELGKGIERMFVPLREALPPAFTFEHDELIQAIINMLGEILQVDKVSLMLIDPENGDLRIKAAKGLTPYVVQNTVKKLGEGIAGSVAKTGKPLLIKDVQKDPEFSESAFYHQYTTKSLICVPVKSGDRVVGVLSANNKQSGEPFDENDLYLGTIFAQLLLLTMQNAQLHFDREVLYKRETEVGNLNRKITAAPDPKSLFRILLSECSTIFRAEFGLLFEADERGASCSVHCLMGSKFWEETLPLNLIREWALSRRESAIVGSETETSQLDLVHQVLKQEVRSVISAPILIQDRLAGSIELASFDPKRFKETDRQCLVRISHQAALAINNSRLYAKLLHSLKEISEAKKEIEKIRRGQFA